MYRNATIFILTLLLFSTVAFPEKKEYRVEGKVLRHDKKPFAKVFPVVFLHGTTAPYDGQTLAGPDGRFVFKKVPPGNYTITSAVPHAGELSKTVVVGPSLADSKGKVVVDLIYESSGFSGNEPTVTAVELSIPDRAIQEFKKAQKCLTSQKVPEAIEHLKKAVQIAPRFSAAWNKLGTISYLTRQYAQAEGYFRTALEQEPGSYPPLVNLGGALLSLSKLDEALTVNLRAVKIKPADPLAHSQLGSTYFYLGHIENAEIHLKRAKSLDPNHFSYPQILLIEIYIRKNKIPAAVSEMENFLQRYPDSEWTPKVRKLLETIRADQSARP